MMKKKRDLKLSKKKTPSVKSAESFVMDHRKRQRSFVLYKRKKNANKDKKEEQKTTTDKENGSILVVKVNHVEPVAPQVERILKKLDMKHMFDATILKNTSASRDLLCKIEQYVTYGPTSHELITQLLNKRGYAKIGTQRRPLNNNTLIEDNLGKFSVICVEDIAHELYKGGENFDEISKFLWSFKLAKPTEKFNAKKFNFSKGGDLGDRGKKISEFLDKMI